MANGTQTQQKQAEPATTAPVNGATTPEKKKQVRAVPALTANPTKAEFDFINGLVSDARAKLIASGIPGVDLSIGKFMLAHALKSMGYVPAKK